MQRKAGDTV